MLSSAEVAELEADIKLASAAVDAGVGSADGFFVQLVAARSAAWQHKETYLKEQREADLAVVRRVAEVGAPTEQELSAARRRRAEAVKYHVDHNG